MPDQHPHLTIAGIPIRVEWPFWVIAVLLGLGAREGWLLAAWVAIVLVSVLVHELGHAFALRAFRQRPHVVLHAFGGLTYGSSSFETRGQSIVVSAAGPLSALVLLGLPAYLYFQSLDPVDEFTSHGLWVVAHDLAWVNIAWSVLNLLPILPLDGGNIAQSVLGPRSARILSIVVAVAAALFLFSNDLTFAAFFFLFFAAMNFNALQQDRVGTASPRPLYVPSPGSSSDPFDVAADTIAAGRIGEGLAAMTAAYRARPSGPTSLAPAERVAQAGGAGTLASMLLAANGPGPTAASNLQAHLRYAGCFPAAAEVGAILYTDGRADRAQTAFDVACALARSGANEHAVQWVRRAIADGFRSAGLLDGEPDLATLRLRVDWPEVRALVD